VEGPQEFRSPTGELLGAGLGGGSPAEAPVSAELQAAIGQAMDRLPEKQRLALILYSVEGLPQKEVAEILECSVELVKWNVFQARKSLRRTLARYLE
jgi:RNA polymerase sigma factor (sigma-70 family)